MVAYGTLHRVFQPVGGVLRCTFIHEHEARAKETFHTTTKQAATLAKNGEVKKLLIGHFSARYDDLNLLLEESQEIFPNTFLAEEGKTFEI